MLDDSRTRFADCVPRLDSGEAPVDWKRRLLLSRMLALAAAIAGSAGIARAETRIDPVAPTADVPWAPTVPALGAGTAQTFDLSLTLPSGIARGGRFGVDPRGAPLPEGMILAPDGTLAAGTAVRGSVVGVLFTYEEP